MFLYFAFANNFIYFAGEGQNLFGFFRINGTYSIATRLMTCTKTYAARSDPVPPNPYKVMRIRDCEKGYWSFFCLWFRGQEPQMHCCNLDSAAVSTNHKSTASSTGIFETAARQPAQALRKPAQPKWQPAPQTVIIQFEYPTVLAMAQGIYQAVETVKWVPPGYTHGTVPTFGPTSAAALILHVCWEQERAARSHKKRQTPRGSFPELYQALRHEIKK